MDNPKILVIEDDPSIWDLLGQQLRIAGFATVFAFDGISAMKVAREEKPDLIVLDIGLPGGDGFVVMKRLRALSATCGIPVIVLSARSQDPNPSRALELGAAAFVPKPYKREELIRLINVALHRIPVPSAS